MKLKTILCSLLALGLSTGTTLIAADKNLKLEAKISKADAKKIALAKVPGGKIKEAELEKENGKLIWSFDIATPGSKDITEVQVDAVTGDIISVEQETPADQKQEKENDKQGKKAK